MFPSQARKFFRKYAMYWPWKKLVVPFFGLIFRYSGLKKLPSTLRVLVIFGVLTLVIIALSIFVPYQLSRPPKIPEISYTQFVDLVDEKRVEREIVLDQQKSFLIPDKRYIFFVDVRDGQKKWTNSSTYSSPPSLVTNSWSEWLRQNGYDVRETDSYPWTYAIMLVFQIAPFALLQLGLMWLWLGGGMKSIGSSWNELKEDALQKRPPVYFKDIGGMADAKLQCLQTIEFLKYSERLKKAGVRMPKGLLIEGPPGTGKTLLATAIATEAGVNAFMVSGSAFRKPLVGLGPDAVNRFFDRGIRNAPCILIIDELDSAVPSRSKGTLVESSEMAAITNTILSRVEEIEKRDLLIFLVGITNLGAQLDEAATRSGRFDRKIFVSNPDKDARIAILKIYLGLSDSKVTSPIVFDPEIKNKESFIDEIAEITEDFSGADIANLINQARIQSVFARLYEGRQEDFLSRMDVFATIPKIMGKVSTDSSLSEETIKKIAWHEAAHTYASLLFKNADPARFVVIQAHSNSLGFTKVSGKEKLPTQSQLFARIKVFLAGHAIEKTKYGEPSTGSREDIKQANLIAHNMVSRFGMSKLGPIFANEEGKTLREDTALEAENIVKRCEKELLSLFKKDGEHYKRIESLAEELIGRPDPKILTQSDIERILGDFKKI